MTYGQPRKRETTFVYFNFPNYRREELYNEMKKHDMNNEMMLQRIVREELFSDELTQNPNIFVRLLHFVFLYIYPVCVKKCVYILSRTGT